MIPAQASRTAFRVALRRAAHQMVDTPPLVFADPFAVAIVGADALDELRRTPAADRKPFSAALRAWVVGRARVAEDTLVAVRARHPGPMQYLVLGAGLDTFALRNALPGVTVFEVDHPATQAWKQERLAAAALQVPPAARLVPVDFESQSLEEQLQGAGFDFGCVTVVAWLGVVPYLSPAAFAATCSLLGRLAPGSELVFDYAQPREVLPPTEQLMHDSLSSRVAQAGEPFQLFFTPPELREELLRHGLLVVEDLGGTELNARLFAARADGLAVRGTAGRLLHAKACGGSASSLPRR